MTQVPDHLSPIRHLVQRVSPDFQLLGASTQQSRECNAEPFEHSTIREGCAAPTRFRGWY
jgi:hypothetical protein